MFIHSFIHSFLWQVQNATIPCCSQELLPFLSVMYFFLPLCLSSNNNRHPVLCYVTSCVLADGHQPFQEPKQAYIFCTMTNKCTIISQIITLLHVSTTGKNLQQLQRHQAIKLLKTNAAMQPFDLTKHVKPRN